jgi:hypothetical protein
MPTITKKELVDRIALRSRVARADVKTVMQEFLDQIIVEQPPVSSAWRAINDRLAKAAGRA